MFNIPVEKMIDKAEGSMFKLVMLASKRAVEIAEGLSPLIEANPNIKTTSVALQEISEGKVKVQQE